MPLYKHAGVQFGAALLAFTLWAAADSWYLLSGLNAAALLSLITALLAGLAVTTVVHEWAHYLGARYAKAQYKPAKRAGFFIFDYDFAANNLAQFRSMSLAGQFGSWLAVGLIYLSIPTDNPGRIMLLSAAIGAAIYAGYIELPVIRRAQLSGDPLAELSKIDTTVLRNAGVWGFASVLGAYWLLA
jgi:hypothetical protein